MPRGEGGLIKDDKLWSYKCELGKTQHGKKETWVVEKETENKALSYRFFRI